MGGRRQCAQKWVVRKDGIPADGSKQARHAAGLQAGRSRREQQREPPAAPPAAWWGPQTPPCPGREMGGGVGWWARSIKMCRQSQDVQHRGGGLTRPRQRDPAATPRLCPSPSLARHPPEPPSCGRPPHLGEPAREVVHNHRRDQRLAQARGQADQRVGQQRGLRWRAGVPTWGGGWPDRGAGAGSC